MFQILGMKVTRRFAASPRLNFIILIFLAASPLFAKSSTEEESCPEGCECTQNRTRLFCQDRSFDGLSIGSNWLNVALFNVQGSEITRDSFGPAVELRHLSWIQSGIEKIQPFSFRSNSRLESIELANNRMRNIPVEAFRSLENLRKLNLGNNSLVGLSKNTFQGLFSLESLKIANNKIAVLPFQAFDAARKLAELDLSGNYLVSLPDHSFRPNYQLLELKLSSNRLTKIPPQLFSGLRHLRVLELNDNDIDFLPKGLFSELNNLERLDLSGNPLTRDGRLSDFVFNGLVNLRWLNIGSSRLKSLPNNLWLPTVRLRTLLLSDTKIESLEDGDFKHLSELQTLEITASPLREIGPHVLKDTPSLRSLSLKDNDMTFLPPSLIHLSHINHIELEGNHWACDCRTFWFVRWAKENIHSTAFDTGLHCVHDDVINTSQALNYLNCTPPNLVYTTPKRKWLIRSEVILECEFSGNPLPSVTWITPQVKIFHWNPDPSFPDAFANHPQVHEYEVVQADFIDDRRIRILENGSLYISKLLREDVGVYKCFAANPIANTTAFVTLEMDPITYYKIKIVSVAVGVTSAFGFLLLTLLVQLLLYILRR